MRNSIDSAHELAEIFAEQVGQDDADRVASAASQAASALMGNVTKAPGCILDSAREFRA